MMSDKIFTWTIVTPVSLLLVAAGCGPRAEGPVTTGKPQLVLRFTPRASTTYRLTTEGKRSVQFQGSLVTEANLKGGETGDTAEMTFAQEVLSVDKKGNATAKITIKELKYLAEVKDKPVLDFDSSRQRDRNSPLAKLVGQSYTIKITPTGQVAEVVDAKDIQAAVRSGTLAGSRAAALVEAEAIRERHTIAALPPADKGRLSPGGSWSDVRTYSFGLMGAKSYERVYTLKEVKRADGRSMAFVEMNAIPTTETAEELHKEQPTSDFSKMFDSRETYTGQLSLDLTAGRVETFSETLRSEWVIVDPAAGQTRDKEPDTLKMAATRLHRLEKIE
ncbi:MAG: hypothetical protein ACYS76_13595 [Planctomycetota bacterium]|jgi:hypothetical protein